MVIHTVVLVTCENQQAEVELETKVSNLLHRNVTVYPGHDTVVQIPSNLTLEGTQRAYKSLRLVSLQYFH